MTVRLVARARPRCEVDHAGEGWWCWVGSTSITAVIPGCAARRRPGIHNHGLGLWIPGSRFARPGMTTVDVVASEDVKLAAYVSSRRLHPRFTSAPARPAGGADLAHRPDADGPAGWHGDGRRG